MKFAINWKPFVVVALSAALSFGVAGCAGPSQNKASESSTPQSVFASAVLGDSYKQPVSSTTLKRSDKLKGAKEETDKDGVVHGVTASGIHYAVRGRNEMGLDSSKVSLCAVGDQIGSDSSLALAKRYGARNGKEYDFVPFYQEVAPHIKEADLRYINQETVMDGSGNYTGYPMFNSPEACAEAISSVEFNMVNFCSNHSFDRGLDGVNHSLEVFARYPKLMVAGSYPSQEARDTVQMIERNGVTFAFLAYTYGENSYGSAENFPNSYSLCGFNKDAIKADVKRAQEVADAVIVSMHWGNEYTHELNDQQIDYAEFLADLDVDLVLGSHAHNMQPFRYVKGPSGNTIPVMFGLSDFISGWTLAHTTLSGLFTCDFVQKNGKVEVDNIVWYPCIEWSDGGDVYVRRLVDMDKSTCDANTRIIDESQSYYDHLRAYVEEVGMECKVVM